MNIGIDIDGVLTNLYDFMIEVGPNFFKREPDNIYGYDFTGMFNVNLDECNLCWDEYLDYYLSLPPREGAKEVIDYFHNKGFMIFIITARVDTLLDKTLEWLKSNDIYYDYFFNPGEDKSKCIVDNNIDVMIEDSPTNIKSLSNYCKIIRMDAKYNTRITGKNILCTKNWNDIKNIIDEM